MYAYLEHGATCTCPVRLTILPLPGGRVDESKQLMSGDGLGVEIHPDWFELHGGIRPVQRSQDLTLSSSSVANDKD